LLWFLQVRFVAQFWALKNGRGKVKLNEAEKYLVRATVVITLLVLGASTALYAMIVPYPVEVAAIKAYAIGLEAQKATKAFGTLVALSHVSPKALVRVTNADGSIKFAPVDEQDAEERAAEFRHQGLYAEVQSPQEQQ
jgi:hypothetical protein